MPTKITQVVLALALSPCPALAADRLDFNEHIRPILSDNCFACHGPDAKKRKADLRLDTRAEAVRVREGVSAIKPGEPENSEMIRRAKSRDPEEVMPPPETKRALSSEQVALLERWIREGAEYKGHWAFSTLTRPTPPTVKDASRAKTELDLFIQERLEREGLTLSDEAPKEKLIRRVSFDLTGLPPTLEEIDAFLRDASADAYESMVERFLTKREYGERMTAEWLDVARYADSYGYQVDRDRYVWPWRDWVIRAFNANMPYDQFVTWQLAGDLLPNATDEQVLATTFNRLHSQEVEGGSIPEEYRAAYIADRTETVGTAFLGLAVACARCHDHKFDPFTQKEYYQLAAFFTNIDEAGLYSYFTDAVPTPTLLLADQAQKAKMAELDREIAEAEAGIAEALPDRRGDFETWLAGPKSFRWKNLLGHYSFDSVAGGKLANAADEKAPATTTEANVLVEGKLGQALLLTGDDAVKTTLANFERHEPHSVALWIKVPEKTDRAILFHRSGGWFDAGSRGYQCWIEDGKLSWDLVHFWPGNAIGVRTLETLPIGVWTHVAVTHDGSSKAKGLAVYINGQLARTEVTMDKLSKTIKGGGGDALALGERFRDRGFKGGAIDDLMIFDRAITPLEVAQIFDGNTLTDLLAKPVAELSAEEKEALFQFYAHTSDGEIWQRKAGLRELRARRGALVDPIPEIMVMREAQTPRKSHVLRRGQYNELGEEAPPVTPAFLPPLPAGPPANRLALARWLTDPKHPLFARVTVNRYWQMIFGKGLTRTSEDFGLQGRMPSHPALLDWLAKDFMDSGWDVKRLLKRMLLSATYRQTSTASNEAAERDPENVLLGRAPRYRLPAEMVRDQALAVSGLLVSKIGGPPAKPYDVALSYHPVKRDEGEGLYRRSIYTYWRRNAPAPTMTTFDTPRRDVCAVKREVTATPLQGFFLLNDPQFVEAARVLAQRLLKDQADLEARMETAFRLLTSRRPTESERSILRRLYDEQLAHFTADPNKAAESLKVGDAKPDATLPAPELAAMTVLVSTLMNHDEFATKR